MASRTTACNIPVSASQCVIYNFTFFHYSCVIITMILWWRAATGGIFCVLTLLLLVDWGSAPPPPPCSKYPVVASICCLQSGFVRERKRFHTSRWERAVTPGESQSPPEGQWQRRSSRCRPRPPPPDPSTQSVTPYSSASVCMAYRWWCCRYHRVCWTGSLMWMSNYSGILLSSEHVIKCVSSIYYVGFLLILPSFYTSV